MVLALLFIASERERQRTTPPTQPPLPPTVKQTYLQRLRTSKTYRVLVRIGEGVLLLAAIGQAVVTFWGPFWPTKPEISFHDTIDASSTVLPFKIKNRSISFPMYLDIKCGVDLLYFMDADKKTGLLRDAVFDVGPIPVGQTATNNYPCTASDYVHIRDDGSVLMGFEKGQSLATKPGAFRAPLIVLKMCMWMSGANKIFGFSIPFLTDMFQWPAAPGQKQWIEGPVIPDLPNEAWIPAGSHIGAAWGIRNIMLADKSNYVPGALQCSGPGPASINFRDRSR
jgi:hypothetical protein